MSLSKDKSYLSLNWKSFMTQTHSKIANLSLRDENILSQVSLFGYIYCQNEICDAISNLLSPQSVSLSWYHIQQTGFHC